jgi:trans-aconitate 2-methyltransferase
LKPYVEALPDSLQQEFLRAFEEGVARSYPARADGSRLFAFPRLFIVARRR